MEQGLAQMLFNHAQEQEQPLQVVEVLDAKQIVLLENLRQVTTASEKSVILLEQTVAVQDNSAILPELVMLQHLHHVVLFKTGIIVILALMLGKNLREKEL